MTAFPDTKFGAFTRRSRWVRSVFFYEHWAVGIVDQPIGNALKWTGAPPVRWIAGFDKKRYLADPFPWPGSKDTILCETFDLGARKGRLIALKLDANGIVDEIPIDLPLAGHLSFPFIFMQGDDVFLMPESSEDRRLEIFRWQSDKGTWVSHAVVFADKPVADAMLFEKDDLFWIAYTDITLHPHDNLHLIYAPSLAGPWLAHPGNPVQQGTSMSRCGGAVFSVEGRLYRPAQDCSKVYGGALRVMEIVTCTTTAYEEKEVTLITPTACIYPDGFHTLTAWGEHCLVDGMRLTFSPALFVGKVLRRLGLKSLWCWLTCARSRRSSREELPRVPPKIQ
jgi:hypothetical protein